MELFCATIGPGAPAGPARDMGRGLWANRASTGAFGSPHRTTSGDLGQVVAGCDKQLHVRPHQYLT